METTLKQQCHAWINYIEMCKCIACGENTDIQKRELLGSMIGRELHDPISDYQFLKTDSALSSYWVISVFVDIC